MYIFSKNDTKLITREKIIKIKVFDYSLLSKGL